MSLFDELLPASFAGVPFFLDISRIEGGRKVAINRYPNSDRQDIEDLGLIPRKFTIDGVTNSNASGDNYSENRDSLLRALESGLPSTLIHPLYGRIENMLAISFTLNESMISLGEARFNITFEKDDGPGIPVATVNSLSVVSSSVDLGLEKLNELFSETFSVSTGFPSNFVDAVSKVNDVITAFSDNTSFIQVAADSIDTFSEELVEIQSNITSLITSPSALKNSISRLFNSVDNLYSTRDSTYEVINQFFNFGDSDELTPIPQDTASRIERLKNRQAINGLIQSQSLLLNYNNAVELTLGTVEEVSLVGEQLENQYQKVLQNPQLDPEFFELLGDVRDQVQSVLESIRANSNQLIEINSVTLPARVLAYNYYGESELGFDIAELNGDLNVSHLSGKLKVFTQ